MNSLHLPALACAALIVAGTLHAAGTTEPLKLRYSAEAPGVTNVYNVTIEARGETGREAITGNLFLTTSAQGEAITLAVRGQMRLKPIPGQFMMGYRPNGPVSLNSLIMGMPISQREISINAQGRLIRTAQDLNLPVPLGQLLASLVEEFPSNAAADWESEREVFVMDDPMLLGPALPAAASGYGPGMYYPNRPPQAALAARQKTKVKILESDAQTVTLQREVALDSLIMAGTEPRISGTSSAKVVRSRVSGLPRSIQMQARSLAITENLSRRSELTLTLQLLEGAEREAALNPAPPKPANPFTPDELAQKLKDINSTESFVRQNAMRELAGNRLEKPSKELLKEIAGMVDDPDEPVREGALSILANHGGKEYVPVLIKALKMPGSAQLRNTLTQALGRIKDPSAAKPLAELLAQGPVDQMGFASARENAVSQALVNLGPEAEPAVLEVLALPNLASRAQACGILKQIGTRKSLEPLKDLTAHPVKELSEAAAEASRWIQSRETK